MARYSLGGIILYIYNALDQLGKYVYENPDIAYKYKGEVVVPPLEMVDDITTISKCGNASVTMHAAVKSFIASNKLKLNSDKCAKFHIGKNKSKLPS